MALRHSAWAALAAWLACSPAVAQEGAGPSAQPEPEPEGAALPVELRAQQQLALKTVWLERLIRAREERHRVTRENLSHCTVLALRLGAPAEFVNMLRRQAAGNLPARERHALESALQDLLAAYGVDARELRFFVEGSHLSAAQLRDVAGWLPLEGMFNIVDPAAEAPSSEEDVAAHYCELLAALRDVAVAWRGVVDLASANAAADALRPVLLRHQVALRPLLLAPPDMRAAAIAPYAADAAPVNEACNRERDRLQEHAWYGSHRLQLLDDLLH